MVRYANVFQRTKSLGGHAKTYQYMYTHTARALRFQVVDEQTASNFGGLLFLLHLVYRLITEKFCIHYDILCVSLA